jgi:hypothetical protein
MNSVTGFDGGSYTPKTYKDVLKHKDQNGWWDSMKKELNAMESKGVWEVVLMSPMPAGRKSLDTDGYIPRRLMEPSDLELLLKVPVKYQDKILQIVIDR